MFQSILQYLNLKRREITYRILPITGATPNRGAP